MCLETIFQAQNVNNTVILLCHCCFTPAQLINSLLPEKSLNFVDSFGEEEATVLPPRETCDCTINLEPGGSIPCLLSTSSQREFLDDSLKEGFNSRASNILRIESPFLFTATIQTLRLFLPIYGANKCIRPWFINCSPRREFYSMLLLPAKWSYSIFTK